MLLRCLRLFIGKIGENFRETQIYSLEFANYL